MGRKRKRSTTNSRKKSGINIDLAVIILFVLSILLFVLIYGQKGVIGEIISPALGGIVGVIKYFIPIGFMLIAIAVAKDDRKYVTSKLIEYAVLIACIAATFSIYQISRGEISADLEFSDIIESAYDLGSIHNRGGGTVGVVIAYPLIKLLGMFGAAIATVGIVVVLCVFTFGLHPSTLLIDIIDEFNMRKEERDEELNNRREQRMARRAAGEPVESARTARRKRTLSDMQAGIEDDDINIGNINTPTINGEAEEKLKKTIFGKKKIEDVENEPIQEKIESNPDVIEENIYKGLAKANEEAAKEQAQSNQDLFTVEAEQKEEKTKAVLQLEHTVSIEDEQYEYPPVSLLGKGQKKGSKMGAKVLTERATQLQRTLHSFGVSAKVENISVGPAITRYELKPAEGVRVSKIANLADDIALNLAAESIRIEAPIPGKQAVGIEIPNREKESVPLRDVIETDEFENNNSKLTIALGKDVAGNVVLGDIAKMPHVLIAGATGSGKSVCINTIITSIVYNSKPSEVKLVMIDPKVVELSVYNGIPHLLIPVVTDPRKAAGALAWAVQEMDNRYNLFAEKGVRDLKGYNAAIENDENSTGKLPQIVIIVDELADLMMVASKEVEDSICRLAQKARACGMHLVIATQRPSVDVITGLIKANIPSRIAFAVSSQIDSRTILDQVGAEKLLGKGDMLFFPASAPKPIRVQGAFVSDGEVEKIVDFIKANSVARYNEDILEEIEKSNKTEGQKEEDADGDDDTDPLLMEAIETVIEIGQASTSFIQRRFKVGYARAGRIIDQMEARGIISGYEGSKPRQVIMPKERWEELKMTKPPEEESQE